MRKPVMLIAAVLLAIGLCGLQQPSHADTGCDLISYECKVKATKPPTPPQHPAPKPSEKPANGPSPAAVKRQYMEALAKWRRANSNYTRCLSEAATGRGAAACGQAPQAPAIPLGQATGVTITPGQAGVIAAARLQLPLTTPGIGPSPDLNEWKMAAVGYPLWLWLDGPTHVGPARDSVGGLSVSLDARVTDLRFQMGDRHVVHCVGTGRRWSERVANTKSPVCGYAYQKPSLPKGNYTVTAVATWSVRWTVNGQSGVINVPVAGSTQLPVGELQVLVR